MAMRPEHVGTRPYIDGENLLWLGTGAGMGIKTPAPPQSRTRPAAYVIILISSYIYVI